LLTNCGRYNLNNCANGQIIFYSSYLGLASIIKECIEKDIIRRIMLIKMIRGIIVRKKLLELHEDMLKYLEKRQQSYIKQQEEYIDAESMGITLNDE